MRNNYAQSQHPTVKSAQGALSKFCTALINPTLCREKKSDGFEELKPFALQTDKTIDRIFGKLWEESRVAFCSGNNIDK